MKKKKKWRDIRSTIVMMCVMLAMLSSATFAWFTLTSNPVVTGLEMTATSSAGLKISKDDGLDKKWYNAVNLSDSANGFAQGSLSPATVLEDMGERDTEPKFYSPVYNGNNVVDVNLLAELDGYVAKYTYYLKYEGTDGPVDVGIITVDPDLVTGDKGITPTEDGVDDAGNANEGGSFVKLKGADGTQVNTTDISAAHAVRIAFVVGNKMYIYEPNAGSTFDNMTAADNKLDDVDKAALASTVASSYADGKITKASTDASTVGTFTSESLFEVTSDGTQVDMYIWFEGQDEQCVDQIINSTVLAQVQFAIVE